MLDFVGANDAAVTAVLGSEIPLSKEEVFIDLAITVVVFIVTRLFRRFGSIADPVAIRAALSQTEALPEVIGAGARLRAKLRPWRAGASTRWRQAKLLFTDHTALEPVGAETEGTGFKAEAPICEGDARPILTSLVGHTWFAKGEAALAVSDIPKGERVLQATIDSDATDGRLGTTSDDRCDEEKNAGCCEFLPGHVISK